MTTARQDAYHVITATNSAIGPGALVINNVGSLPLEWKRPLEIPQRAAEEGLGRTEELAELHSRFREKSDAAITGLSASGAVRGLPGVGKSTLAAL